MPLRHAKRFSSQQRTDRDNTRAAPASDARSTDATSGAQPAAPADTARITNRAGDEGTVVVSNEPDQLNVRADERACENEAAVGKNVAADVDEENADGSDGEDNEISWVVATLVKKWIERCAST